MGEDRRQHLHHLVQHQDQDQLEQRQEQQYLPLNPPLFAYQAVLKDQKVQLAQFLQPT